MAEKNIVENTPHPLTVTLIVAGLREIGVQEGQTILVHSALSKLGWVVGGAHAVVLALVEAVGESGTLVMPTQSTFNTDPSNWSNPAVPETWWPVIRENMPAYDPVVSPTRQMGQIVDVFRNLPGTIRSAHPIGSFAAHGKHAKRITDNHILTEELSMKSPLGRIYDLDGYVLLLGVDHLNNTSLHLAETIATFPGKHTMTSGAAMIVNGKRQWVDYEHLDFDSDDFQIIGMAFEAKHNMTIQKLGNADVRFIKQRELVDFASAWMNENRDQTA